MKANTRETIDKTVRRAVIEAMEDRTLFTAYVVTTTADSGTGSLRAAIQAANAHAGADVIQFQISWGVKTIVPVTALPTITDAVTLDGTTQPGYWGRPIIELNGSTAHGYGLNITAGNSTVKGMVINRFSTGILMMGGGGNVVKNCYIGTGCSGVTHLGNSDKGIIVQSANNLIGGGTAADRNVISANGSLGIQLYTTAATGNHISGNYIGTDYTGTVAVANGTSGININGAPNNTIGGASAGFGNLLSGNVQDGIVVNQAGATGNLIAGNFIGTDVTGKKKLGNGNYGVEISQANNVVGGTTAGQRNIISGNGYTGLVLWLGSATGNLVEGNYIGTDVSGSYALGNTWRGIDVSSGASNNVIGGVAVGAGNLVSGNNSVGIEQYQGSGNRYSKNTVGFNVGGNALGNGDEGMLIMFTHSGSITGSKIGNSPDAAIRLIDSSGFTQSGNTFVNDNIYGF